MITRERLMELFDYNPSDGLFVRRAAVGNQVKGTIAGTVDKTGYIMITINYKRCLAHRLAFLFMTGSMPPDEVDHLNGVKTDNRFCNLRQVDRTENCHNTRMLDSNTSGVTGVYWNKNRNKWRAHIKVNNRKINLGSFGDFDEAVAARKKADIKYGFNPNHGRLA